MPLFIDGNLELDKFLDLELIIDAPQ